MKNGIRINYGCGLEPTKGYRNFDNSACVKLAKHPILTNIFRKCGMLTGRRAEFIEFCKNHEIEFGNCTKRMPFADDTVGVFYSSHMMEHLDRSDARLFLKEVHRILATDGILRLALPDVSVLVSDYVKEGDADKFMDSLCFCTTKPVGFLSRLSFAFYGFRDHMWMYDGASLCRFLKENGFEAKVYAPGETSIPEPGELNLSERLGQSVYVEAVKR